MKCQILFSAKSISKCSAIVFTQNTIGVGDGVGGNTLGILDI